MIHSITGTVQARKKQAIMFAVGPICVDLLVPDESLFQIGSACTIYIHLHWNSDQGMSMYGFEKEIDKKIFLLVTSCSGVGPRIGLAVLADLGGQSFIEAVNTGDERLLSRVSGIGAKKAEQMIVQLKHKVQDLIDSGVQFQGSVGHAQWQTVSEALRALNYSRTEINQAVNFVRSKESGAKQSFDQLLRQTLSFLSRQS